MQDPISDMLTRIRNGMSAKKTLVSMYYSNKKCNIAKLMHEEGYITNFSLSDTKTILTVYLKYYQGSPVISILKRISRPGIRVYKKARDLPKVYGGFGISIVSTSKGLMSDKNARAQVLGGEIICYIA